MYYVVISVGLLGVLAAGDYNMSGSSGCRFSYCMYHRRYMGVLVYCPIEPNDCCVVYVISYVSDIVS